MVQLSIGFSGSKSLNEYITLAKIVDQYGFHTLSIFDDLMFKPAWPILTLMAHHTKQVRIGPSIANPYLIHPAVLAGNIALLDELSNGRAYLGIGRGAFLDFLNLKNPKPITTVREAIGMIKRLLSGDATAYQGKIFQATEAATLQWTPPRPHIPIMVGTWGPKMCAMAGELADEVKAGPMWSVKYAHFMGEHIKKGAQSVGRDPNEVGLVFGPLTSISEDRETAKALARRTLAFYLPYLAPMPEKVGVEPEEIERIKAAATQADMFAEWKSTRYYRQVDREGEATGLYIMLFEFHTRAGHHAYKARRKDWSGPYAEYKSVDPYQFFDMETVTTEYWEPQEVEHWFDFD